MHLNQYRIVNGNPLFLALQRMKISLTSGMIIWLVLLLISCKSTNAFVKNESNGDGSEWIYLFDGSTTDGWRNFNSDKLSEQWVIKDGALTFDTEMKLEEDRKGGGDIVYVNEEFDNFELYVEWKIPEGGNSGIFYHLQEGVGSPPEISPEYQLLDDLKWEEINDAKLEDWQKTGADYAMYVPDESQKIIKPAGEWNNSRIIFTPENVEHWLNGKKLLSFVPWSTDWEERKMAGKWKDFPKYGTFTTGYIGFQDHDSPLWLKNIKVKRL